MDFDLDEILGEKIGMIYIEIDFFMFYNFGKNFFLVMKVNVEDYDVIMG